MKNSHENHDPPLFDWAPLWSGAAWQSPNDVLKRRIIVFGSFLSAFIVFANVLQTLLETRQMTAAVLGELGVGAVFSAFPLVLSASKPIARRVEHIFLWALGLAIFIAALQQGGVAAHTPLLVCLIPIFAGVMLGEWACFVTAVICAVVICAMFIASHINLAQSSGPAFTQGEAFLTAVRVLVVLTAAATIIVFQRTTQSALRRMLAKGAELQHTAQELRRSNGELEQFAYASSHDLRAPLRGINALAGWIEEDLEKVMNDESRENIKLMRGRIARLERLLDDLLTYARAGRVSAAVRRVDAGQMVQDIAELVAPETAAVSIMNALPVFETAQAPFEQVVRNLIQNAIKHHDQPRQTIKVSCRDQGDTYEFAVADDGPGIAAEFHERIFGVFETLKSRDEVEGSGMGLAIIKKTVESAGGSVAIESDPEQARGTTFRFTWPKYWPQMEAMAA